MNCFYRGCSSETGRG